MLAPVVTGFSISSGKRARSNTIWRFLIVVPSLSATNCTFLLPRRVRTHPLTSTTVPVYFSGDERISFIVVLFIFSII